MAYRYLLVALSVVLGLGFSGCGNDEAAKKQARADSIARAKHEQDSIARAMADSVAAAEAEAASQMEEASVEVVEEVSSSSDGLSFHVIKGSFTIPENADNFLAVQQASHPQAKIFTAPNGFKLVSIADFATMQEAVAMINSQGVGESRLWVYQEGGPYNTSSWLEEKSGMGGGESYSESSSSSSASASSDDDFDDFDGFGDDEFE